MGNQRSISCRVSPNEVMPHRDGERRVAVSEALAEHTLDALVCATPVNVLMLSGYWPVIGKSVAIATRNGDLVVLVPEDESELAKASGACVKTYSPAILEKPISLSEALSAPLREALGDLGLNSAQLGIETGPQLIPSAYVSVHVFGDELSNLISAAVHNAVLVTSDRLLASLRSKLTSREQARVMVSCGIAANAFRTAAASLEPGRTEAEVAADLRRTLSTSVGYDGARRVDGSVWCMSGPNSAKAYAAFQQSTERRIEEGDLVLIHCNSYADGYWTDITRTFIVGEGSERQRDLLDALWVARSTALDAVKPGVRAEEVDRASREVMSERGYGKAFKHGLGHGVGFVAIDHDAPPRLTPGSPDVIDSGMAFNIEPGAYFDGWGGARHCDMLLCTDSGPQLLTDF